MTIENWLRNASALLENSQVGTARLDTLVLLEDSTGKDRAWLLAHPEYELSEEQVQELEKLLKRRAAHEPLSYIRGKVEFYGREFVLTPVVLEPRPESETMIDLLKTLPLTRHAEHVSAPPAPIKHDVRRSTLDVRSASSIQHPTSNVPVRIADVGTGSGALGITAALELPSVSVELLDIDPKAIEVAKINVDKFTLSINVTESDLLTDATQDYDVLLCNLPYVPDSHTINQAATHEPKLAIFGGPDGLDVYRKLFNQIDKRKHKPLYILSESLPPQHVTLATFAERAGYRSIDRQDFIQAFQLTHKID